MYNFEDEQPTTPRPQLLTEQLLTENFGSLLDFDELPGGSEEGISEDEDN